MDWSHFGMDRPPFRPAVDAAAYYPAPSHAAALAALVAAFARRDPVVLIDGPSGVGKSLVARKWLDDLLPDVPRVLLPNARAETPADLLQAILFDLGKPYQGLSTQELRLAVTGHLLDAAASGFPTVIVIDEAQHLSPSALEELRLLGNLESRTGAVAFVVLVAQPVLRAALRGSAHAPFADRIAVRCLLAPLSAEEAPAYLHHQVRAAGGEPLKVLDEGATALIASACGGLPRVLNRAAALAFELAAEAGAEVVDVEAALEALERLGIAPPDEDGTGDAVLLPHPGRETEPERRTKRKPASGERGAARGPKVKAVRKRPA
ncbi:AAA family ATPase [Gemmata sp. G18]|uniref:AAA family ATPase n=1 Tax=Gemmata palustris TaxID=2822762 RepID=A0ABS5BR01_9BACT|nr:AAA family ATPase [Gemmata palustris]MBP3956148.1 AAA family ATPase [Gemmata palustris]